jgi:hypothetical protein
MLSILLVLTKSVYVVQPYEVGSKERKSLAIIIPAKIAREYDVNKSTILALSINEKGERITLQKVVIDQFMMKPADESFAAFQPAGVI